MTVSPIAIGMFAIVAYSLYLQCKALWKLYREGEKRLVLIALAAWLLGLVLVVASAWLPEAYLTIWTALPILILFFFCACFGFFLESFRKSRAKELEMGIYRKHAREASPQTRRRNLTITLVGLALWLVGALVEIPNQMLEYCLLCVSLLLFGAGVSGLWRYRKF